MKHKIKGEIMDNLKKVGLTALAGSLAAISSANAAEMSVSGATVLTYTTEDGTEVTGNPWGMKTNLGFTASGEVNGYTVSYMQTSADQFAGMSSARLSIDMGDMGTLAFDQGSGSGLSTIDDKTPTAAEEIWDGLDTAGSSAGAKGLVGASSSGAWNYIQTLGDYTFNGSFVAGSATSNADGASSANGNGGNSWDFAITGAAGDNLSWGFGFGDISANTNGEDSNDHTAIFANYTAGSFTFGYSLSEIDPGLATTTAETTNAWGIAMNVNDNLSISYGEREVEFDKATAADVTEEGSGVAVAYTMGSIKVTGNRNEVGDNDGTAGSTDEMTEIAVSFAF
jgi:outer membrane protein OmpU